MGDTVRRLPTGVLAGLAVVLLSLGGFWWTRAAPAAAATENATPISHQVTVRLDDGRIFTYRMGRTFVSDPTSQQRRGCRRSATRYPSLRVVGQDAPPVFLTRCR